RYFLVPLFQSELGLFAVVEVDDAVADDLIGLVSLAGDNDDVGRGGAVDGVGDGVAAVLDRLDVRAGDAGHDLLDDRLRILAAGVVAGDDDAVGHARGDLPHLRALPLVAVAAAAEDDPQPALRREVAHGGEELLQRVGLVSVVDDDGGGVGRQRADILEAAAHRGQRANALLDGARVDADGDGRADGAEPVVEVRHA